MKCSRIERRRPDQQLVEDHAQRIDVGPRVDVHRRRVGLLGRHVRRRADDGPGVAQALVGQENSVALATPKSMTLGIGRPSTSVTSTLLGFRSRWMIPFWWACCTAWQTATNNSRRALHRQSLAVAVIGDRLALNELHHEERLAGLGGAAVEHAGDVGVVHQGECLPLGVEASEDRARVHADLDQLERDLAFDWCGLACPINGAHAPLAEDFEQRVPAGDDLAHSGSAGPAAARGDRQCEVRAVGSKFPGRQCGWRKRCRVGCRGLVESFG